MSGTELGQKDLSVIIRELETEELRAVLLSACDRHADVERHVRLAAARAAGDLTALRSEVARGLGTRRFLGYRESSAWAHGARPVVDDLRPAAERASSNELVLLARARRFIS